MSADVQLKSRSFQPLKTQLVLKFEFLGGGKRNIFPTNERSDLGVTDYLYIYSFSICLVIPPITKLSIALCI